MVVKAQRQLIKQDIDRIAYDVQADEESKTQTVMDMLRKVPMVTVDGQDNIQVKGNSSFKVYKNGHLDPSLTRNAKEVFKSMPASTVKRIEVITDPGAREDAEGVDAILNIVTLSNTRMQGVTGVLSSSINTLGHSSFYSSLTSQLGKLMLSVDYGYSGMTRHDSYNRVEKSSTYLDTRNTMLGGAEGSNPGDIHYATISTRSICSQPRLAAISIRSMFRAMATTSCSIPLVSSSIAIATATGCQATTTTRGMVDSTISTKLTSMASDSRSRICSPLLASIPIRRMPIPTFTMCRSHIQAV